MTSLDDDEILCATYTHARRHPMVLGNIGGWTPPFQLTLVQVGVLLVSYFIEVRTWSWWGAHLPRAIGVVTAIGVPCVLAWVVRRTRLEGRSLPRVALGWVKYLSMPRGGVVGGRPVRRPRPSSPLRHPVYVASLEEHP